MRGSLRFLFAWFAATLIAVVVATAAVGSVRSQVTEAPTQLSSPDAAALVTVALSTSPTTAPGVEPPTSTTTTSTPDTSTTTSTVVDSSTSTTEPTSGTVPSTTVPSTTTTVAQTSYTKTIDTKAGSVRVVVDGSKVTFGGAYPNPGWKVELGDGGPEKVNVKFEQNGGEGELEVTARVSEGELKIDIDEHGSHDD